MPENKRIYLSPPHMGPDEFGLLEEAFRSNWIAPLGPHVDAFEREFAQAVGVDHAASLSSGTAAIHLGLRLLGMQAGDEVICSTWTFAASANPIAYDGAHPVFLDSEADTGNLDPNLLEDELRESAARGRLPRAVVVVDLYGQCAAYETLVPICARYGVPLLEDAAEALGASRGGRPAGTFGACAAFSFNGNKIITTSGGGMLVSNDGALVAQARMLASQARDPAPHYQHSKLGFNYRMSNLLAAVGRGQLRVLGDRVERRRAVRARYVDLLGDLPGVTFLPESPGGRANAWLTCATFDPARFGATREEVRVALEAANIESRPFWKPLHDQPIFASCRRRVTGVADRLFRDGLCLPSGSNLSPEDQTRIADIVRSVANRRFGGRV